MCIRDSINAKDYMDRTPLHHAANQNRKEAARILINHGCEINCKDKRNHTPLDVVSKFGGKQMADFLISQGAKGSSEQ